MSVDALYCEVCKKQYAFAGSGHEARYKEWKHCKGKRHQKKLKEMRLERSECK